MSSMGLRSIVVKKFRPHSSKSSIVEKDNILNRDFQASSINQKWCTDITYIHKRQMDLPCFSNGSL